MLSTAAAEVRQAGFRPVLPPDPEPARSIPSALRARRRPPRRVVAWTTVAAAHLALLLALAQALRLPRLPQTLATLSVHLVGAQAPDEPAPAALPAPPQAPTRPPPLVPAATPAFSVDPSPAGATVDLPPTPSPARPTAAAPPPPAPAAPAPVATLPAPPASAPEAGPPAAVAERQVSIDQVAYLSPPALAYPLAARRLREQGLVLVRVRVDEAGRPALAVLQQSSGSRTLDDAALAAVAATRFKPYREGGLPRPFWVVMPLVFSLDA